MSEALSHKTDREPMSVSVFLTTTLTLVKAYGNTELSIPSSKSLRRFFRKCLQYGNTDIPMPDADQISSFLKECVKYGNTDIPMPDADQVGSFLKECVKYGNTDIPMPDADQVGEFLKSCVRFGKKVLVHCMTEKIDDSEDVMHAFSEAMEYVQIKIRARLRFLVRVVFFLFHGRDLCISTQCLIL